MKIISFNINGLRARIHQLSALIDKHNPEIIGLQETKVHNDAFPFEDVESLGYKAYIHGQKAHYGVAMLVRNDMVDKIKMVREGFPTDNEDHQKRMVMVTVESERGFLPYIINFGRKIDNTFEIKFDD